MIDKDPTEEPTVLDGLSAEEEMGIDPEPEPEAYDEIEPDIAEYAEAMDEIYLGALDSIDPELGSMVETMDEEDWDALEEDNPEAYHYLMGIFDKVDEYLDNNESS